MPEDPAATPPFMAAREILKQSLKDAKSLLMTYEQEAVLAHRRAENADQKVTDHKVVIASIEAGIARLSDG